MVVLLFGFFLNGKYVNTTSLSLQNLISKVNNPKLKKNRNV